MRYNQGWKSLLRIIWIGQSQCWALNCDTRSHILIGEFKQCDKYFEPCIVYQNAPYSNFDYLFESAHEQSLYNINDAIKLSEDLVPVVFVKTIETEYLGRPWTNCIQSVANQHVGDIERSNYDKSVCQLMKIVEFIVDTCECFPDFIDTLAQKWDLEY